MTALQRRRTFLDNHMSVIATLYPGVHTVYGPYSAKDGRYRVVLYDGITRRTRQFCKLYLEVKLKQRIEEPKTVDHDNGCFRDDRLSNLLIRTRVDHATKDAKRRKRLKRGQCVQCATAFDLGPYQEVGLFRGKGAGPFCSRTCSGAYGASVQNGGSLKKRDKLVPIYYRTTDPT